MKKQALLVLLLFFFVAFGANAQDKKKSRKGEFISFNIGAGPGSMTGKLTQAMTSTTGKGKDNTIGYDLDYNTMNYAGSFEFVLNQFGFLFEGSYSKATYDNKMKDYTDENWFKLDPNQFTDLTIIGGAAMLGGNYGAGRFKFTIYGGAGLYNYSGEPIHGLSFDFLYKIRAKFYITNKLGLYGGIGGSYGMFGYVESDKYRGPSVPEDKAFEPDGISKRIHVEAGLTVQFGRKKKSFLDEKK